MLENHNSSAPMDAAHNVKDATASVYPQKREIEKVVKRIKRMEKCFDALVHGAAKNPPVISKRRLAKLISYYENGQWRQDFELDERGYLPQDLKRGVLSEDGVYNFLAGLNSEDAD